MKAYENVKVILTDDESLEPKHTYPINDFLEAYGDRKVLYLLLVFEEQLEYRQTIGLLPRDVSNEFLQAPVLLFRAVLRFHILHILTCWVFTCKITPGF